MLNTDYLFSGSADGPNKDKKLSEKTRMTTMA